MAQWQSLQSNKMLRKENTFEDGVDTENNAFFISENSYASGYGWDTDIYPALATRKGKTEYGAPGGGATWLLTNFGNTHLFRAVGTKLQYNSTGTTWTDISGTFAQELWDSTNFDISGPSLIITNGTDTPRRWNGTTLGSISQMPKGKYVASDNRRVYTAGVTGSEDSVFYCAFQDALDWTTVENSGEVQFYTANGGAITGIHAFEGQIYAFKKDAFCQIFHTGDSRVTHRLVEVSNDIGCESFRTIVEVGPYLIWLGDRDVFLCAGGTAVSIGEPVREILQSIVNPEVSCAWTDDYRYYLALSTVTGVITDTEIVYDTRYKTWHVRTRQLAGMVYGALFNNRPYGGWITGITYKLNDGYMDDADPIEFLLDSKPYDEGVGEAEKEYYELHIQGFIDTGSTMDVSISVDDRGTSFTLLDSLTAQSVSQNKNIIVPMDTVALTHWMRYRLSGTGYVEVNKLQRYSRVQPVQI